MRQRMPGAGTGVWTAVLTAVVAIGVAACSGGSSSSSSAATTGTTTASPTSSAQAGTQITENWSRFFDSQTPADQKAALLQNGDQFAPYIQQMAQSPLAQGVTARVSKVEVDGGTATVTYSVLVNGQPVLQDQTGQAVLENGTWKVGTGSFCALLALQGSVPPQCGSSSGSATPSAPTS